MKDIQLLGNRTFWLLIGNRLILLSFRLRCGCLLPGEYTSSEMASFSEQGARRTDCSQSSGFARVCFPPVANNREQGVTLGAGAYLRWCTKTSESPFVSPATRLLASEVKATTRPVAESEAKKLSELP